jgi:hypothetical protein
MLPSHPVALYKSGNLRWFITMMLQAVTVHQDQKTQLCSDAAHQPLPGLLRKDSAVAIVSDSRIQQQLALHGLSA